MFKKKLLANSPLIFGIIAILTAFLGFFFDFNNGLIESFYRVFALFGGDGDAANKLNESYWLQVAAITAPLSVTFLIIHLFSRKIRIWLFLTFKAKDHFIICGLGDMGSALAKNLLTGKKLKDKGYSKLIIIDSSENNPNIEEMIFRGAIVLIGDANSESLLKKIKVSKSKSIVLFSGNDIVNLEIAISMSQFLKESTSVYTHLDNRDNYELLRSEVFQKINIKSFNLYDSAAQVLFMEHPLGCNVDTISENEQVKIALVGFDKVGESILYRILNLAHFYNQVPVHVDIYDFDIDFKRKEFLKSYPIDQEICKDYWSINFKEESDFYINNINYTQIIFCSIDSNRSIQDSMRFMKTNTSELSKDNAQIYLFSDTHYKIATLIENNKNEFNNLYTFGNFHKLCNYDVIINEELDKMAKKSDERYNQLHGYRSTWDKLDSFLKDSNRMQIEHLSIKLKIINYYLSKQNKQGNYNQIKEQALKKWFIHGGNMMWDKMLYTKLLVEAIPLEVLNKIAIIEHNRWNAFHILNGWKKIDIPKNSEEKVMKDKVKKLHPCLVSWNKLDEVSINHKHDYKSDDIETVMRIGDMLEDIDICYTGFNKLKNEFYNFVKLKNEA